MITHNDLEQGSDAWFKLRCGIPTASEFAKLITGTGSPSASLDKYSHSKACEKFAMERVDPFSGNMWTEAGTEDEDDARNAYEFTSGYKVVQIGFVTDDDVTCGCSPDSLVNDDGLLELKRLKGDLLVEMNLYYKKHNKLMPKYVPQVQGQMMICERKWCDIVFYNPLLPSLKVHVKRDDEFITTLKEQINKCNNMRDETLKIIGW